MARSLGMVFSAGVAVCGLAAPAFAQDESADSGWETRVDVVLVHRAASARRDGPVRHLRLHSPLTAGPDSENSRFSGTLILAILAKGQVQGDSPLGPVAKPACENCVTVAVAWVSMTRSFGAISCSLVAGAASALVSVAALADPVRVADTRVDTPQIFEYRINHALYGDIGTYRNIVERSGETVAVRSVLDIAVRFLGFAVYREAGERLERWHGDRLVEFRSVTDKNGERLEVTGEARDDGFVVKGPLGIARAPRDVRPSNPWSVKLLNADTVMSTTTGRLFPTRVKGGAESTLTLNGQPRKLRRFDIFTDKPEFVWLDERDVAVVFGTEDNGSRVEFILTRITTGDGDTPLVRPDKLPPAITVANEP